ncbi:MAG: HAD family hydrolase [Bifidobacterium sp.]|nr:HAD family hydrolase [Bifidobacterium sp.]
MSEPRKYDTILFDLYGTLVDIHTDEESEAAWTALRCALYRDGADFVTNAHLRHTFTREVARANAVREQGEWFEPDLLPAYRALFESCWIDATAEQAREVAWAFRRASTSRIKLFDGAREMLDTLRGEGRKLVLVSNAQACYTRPELELLELEDAFDEVLLSSDEGVRKPSIELFRRALIRADAEPETALMVGNDEMSDIAGAAAAGIDAAYLHTDDHLGGRSADRAAVSLEGPDYAGLLDFIHQAE